MRYIVTVQSRGSRLANSKSELNRIIANIEEGPGIICTAWSENTPADIMAKISESILGNEKSMLVGLQCIIDSTPLHEMLWEEFEKALS